MKRNKPDCWYEYTDLRAIKMFDEDGREGWTSKRIASALEKVGR